jgi:hypothetical protein
MDWQSPETWKAAAAIVQALGIAAAGVWVLWRLGRERVDAPQIAFSVDTKLHGPSQNQFVAEHVFTFENKGKTRVEIGRISILVRGIKADEDIHACKGKEPRLFFTHELVNDQHFLPAKYGHVFFEPGIKQEYRYISAVPADMIFLLVHGTFRYAAGNPHSAEKIISI